MSYELKTDASGQYRFNLNAGNGEIILSSKAYTTKAAAEEGIAGGPDEASYERKDSASGQPYFVLKAKLALFVTVVKVGIKGSDVRHALRSARGCRPVSAETPPDREWVAFSITSFLLPSRVRRFLPRSLAVCHLTPLTL